MAAPVMLLRRSADYFSALPLLFGYDACSMTSLQGPRHQATIRDQARNYHFHACEACGRTDLVRATICNRSSRGPRPETRAKHRGCAARTVQGGLRVAVCGEAEAGDALSRPQARPDAATAAAPIGTAQVIQALQPQRIQVRQTAREAAYVAS